MRLAEQDPWQGRYRMLPGDISDLDSEVVRGGIGGKLQPNERKIGSIGFGEKFGKQDPLSVMDCFRNFWKCLYSLMTKWNNALGIQKNMRIPKKLNAQEADVMIVDAAGSDYIKHCIPATASVEILPLRGVVPWLKKPRFFMRVCARLIQQKSLGHSIVCAIIDVVKPKVLITYVDNSPLMGDLLDIFPAKLVISVQNGLRSEIALLGGDVNYKLPVLYGYGVYEKTLFEKMSVKISEYVPVGSLKYGIFRQNNSRVENKYDICYIPSFDRLSCGDFWHSKGQKMGQKYARQLFLNLVRVCKDDGYRFVVALRGRAGSRLSYNQRNYFKSLDPDNVAELVNVSENDLGSYKTAASATVNIALISTLAMEIFGGGGKVLWVHPPDLLTELGVAMNYEKVPEELILESLWPDLIKGKFITLSKMEQKKYLELTESARNFYMKCQWPYPHDVIKERIADFIENYELS